MLSENQEILDYFQNDCSKNDLDIITGIAHEESPLKYSDIDRYIKKCNKVATKFNNEYVKYNWGFGKGGQAIIRDYHNAVGIPTKNIQALKMIHSIQTKN